MLTPAYSLSDPCPLPRPYTVYRVGETCYTNKWEALEASKKGHPLVYLYGESEWRRLNWTSEPSASLASLYEKRAAGIREAYDYVIVAYSGGADSWNVLESFARAKAHVDEIVSFHDWGITGRWDSLVNAEVKRVAIPYAEAYEKNRHTKHFLIESREVMQSVLSDDVDTLLQTYYVSPLSPLSPLRGGGFMGKYKRWTDRIIAGKKVALVWGFDKPFLRVLEGRYAFQFSDVAEQALHKKHSLNPFADIPVYDELFYFSPAVPEMVIKMCHVLARGLDSLPAGYRDPYPINWGAKKAGVALWSKTGRIVSPTTMNRWLYGWDPATFSLGRHGGSAVLSAQDEWITGLPAGDPLKAKWMKLAAEALRRYGESGPVVSSEPYFLS